jgi:16S rRNA processing protein RimM
MKKDFLEAGKIVALHGIKGEMRLKPWSDDSSFLKNFEYIYFGCEGENKTKLISARAHGNVTLLKIEGVDSIEQAEKLRGKVVYIKKSDAELPEGSYFVSDILGCEVFDNESGELLGTVGDIESYPANDVWHIKTASGEVLIPNVPDIVKKVCIDENRVYIYKMKGLFGDAD